MQYSLPLFFSLLILILSFEPFKMKIICQLHFLFFIRKPQTVQHSFLFCFDLGAEEGRHRLHASLVHLRQTFLSSTHLLGRLE